MNELMTRENHILEESDFIFDLTSQSNYFCSMKAETPEEKAKLFEAMNNPAKRLGDCVNMVIKVKDMFCEVVKCTNKETGEITQCPRIVLIDEDGVGYQCVSLGVFSAMKKLIALYGEPTWEPALPLEIKQINRDTKRLLTFNVKTK